jgi:hypothetical protein
LRKSRIALLFFALMSLTVPNSPGQVVTSPEPSNCDYQLDHCFHYGLPSAHFIVFYDTDGPMAVAPQWVQNVSAMAEAAFTKLVTVDGFSPPARDPLPIYLDLAKGGFTNFSNCLVCHTNSSGLANLQIEYRYKSPCPRDCGIPRSNWEVAHEVFAAIEFSMFNGPLTYGTWLSESSANWAGYQVAGNESRWDPWVISAWMGPNGSTETFLNERPFSNAFLLEFLSEHYGGPQIVKRILLNANLSNAGDDIAAQLRGSGYGESLSQVMSDFGAAMLTGNFTQADGASAVLRSSPPIGTTTVWNGTGAMVSTFTSGVNGHRAGDKLKITVPYGIEFVRVRPDSGTPLSVKLNASEPSCFASKVVAREGSKFVAASIGPTGFTLRAPNTYSDLIVVVSRGSCSNGEFALSLQAGSSGTQGSPLFEETMVFAIVAALIAVFTFSYLRLRPRRM